MNVVLVAFRGHFSDSPRALYEAMLERRVDASFTWVSAPHTQAGFPPDVDTVPFGSPECIAALEAADLVISNDHIPLDWHKRPEVTYLQTWHGTPLKRIHNDVPGADASRMASLERDVARWDLLLSPNAATTPRLQKAFGYTGPVHETGLPRNDLLSSPQRDEVRAKVRADLGIGETQKAVLYTPTWRDDLVFEKTGPRDFEFAIDLEDFAARLGEDTVLLFRLHSMVVDRLEIAEGSAVRDVCSHPDVRDLYLAADVMVTDYSSTMFDFAITGKPLLFYTYDLEHFREELRGFYYDLAEIAPTPLYGTSRELVDALADVDRLAAATADRYARFRETFCSREDGRATERVLDLLTAVGALPATSRTPATATSDRVGS